MRKTHEWARLLWLGLAILSALATARTNSLLAGGHAGVAQAATVWVPETQVGLVTRFR